MRGFVRFLGIFIFVFALVSAPVSAAQISASGKITISGTVAPAKYAYVNEHTGSIEKIISNCNTDAPVTFIRQSDSTKMTPSIYLSGQYSKIKNEYNLNMVGNVYSPPPLEVQKSIDHLYLWKQVIPTSILKLSF